jgi:hypothetical protein
VLQRRFKIDSQKIKSVYFQKWIGGKESKTAEQIFYIEFEAPLSQDIKLSKIYFQKQGQF